MSSVGSTSAKERNNQMEELKRLREEYENEKAEDTKRHKREVARLQETYNKKMDEMREAQQEAQENASEKFREVLTRRDEKNIESTENLRRMYSEQIKRKMTENEEMKKSLVDSYENQLKKDERISQQQRDSLVTNFRNSLNERDRNFDEYATNARETMQNSLKERTEKLNDMHKKQLDDVRDQRDEDVAEIAKAKSEEKSYLQNKIREMEKTYLSENAKREGGWMKTYQNQEVDKNNTLYEKDQSAQDDRKFMQAEYRDRVDEKQSEIQQNWENLRDQVKERSDNEVSSLKHELNRARHDTALENISNNRLTNLDRKNLVQSYENRMRSLEAEKAGIIDVAKEHVKEKVLDTVDKTQKLLQSANHDHRLQQNLTVHQAEEDHDQLVNNYEARLHHAETRGDQRMKTLYKATTDVQKNQLRAYDENLNKMKVNYEENLINQREIHDGSLAEVRSRMEKRLQDTLIKGQDKLERVVDNYQAQIEKLKLERDDEIKKLSETSVSKDKQREKEFRMQQDEIISKYETRIAAQEEYHRKDMDRLEKRHQEQMATLAARLNAFSKKA
jgi:hypothetical protein